jgi:NTP pyrophosphatase (non-canonical NTP hydrolase)
MKETIKEVVKFRDDRDWRQFHTPANLAKSIVLEAAELLENYQWGDEDADEQNVKDEIADIMMYCILLADIKGYDIEELIKKKLVKNIEKYPVDKAKGKSNKYSDL